jgi:hypothetical protein
MAESPQETNIQTLLKVIQSWLPVLTVVAGGLWGLYTYIDHQKEIQQQLSAQADRDATTRRIEAQKPFLEKQLALYFETAQIAGQLVTLKHGGTDWDKVEQRFWALYWSELSMVEHGIVESAMKSFGDLLKDYDKSPNDPAAKSALDVGAYELAHAIRSGIESAWSGNQIQNNRM